MEQLLKEKYFWNVESYRLAFDMKKFVLEREKEKLYTPFAISLT